MVVGPEVVWIPSRRFLPLLPERFPSSAGDYSAPPVSPIHFCNFFLVVFFVFVFVFGFNFVVVVVVVAVVAVVTFEAAACHRLFMLTCTMLMTSHIPKACI